MLAINLSNTVVAPLRFCCLLGMLFVAVQHAQAQSQPMMIEGVLNNNYLQYQHILRKQFSEEGRLGIFQWTQYRGTLFTPQPLQGINHALISVKLNKPSAMLFGAGVEPDGNIHGKIGFQYFITGENYSLYVSPRLDAFQHIGYEFFALGEFKPELFYGTRLYLGMQLLSTWNNDLDRTFDQQQFRLGIDLGTIQFGFSGNRDFLPTADEDRETFATGIFVRRLILN